MTVRAIVLYEDQRRVQAKEFGPHQLVLACVADRIGRQIWDIQASILPMPLKGASNVKARLELEVGSHGQRVVAVFDRDRIDRVYPGMASCLSGLRDAIRRAASPSTAARLSVVLLDRNMETVLDACLQVTNAAPRITKPKPAERDRILAAVAFGDGDLRRAVLGHVPSLDYLVTKLADLF